VLRDARLAHAGFADQSSDEITEMAFDKLRAALRDMLATSLEALLAV
jgi:hypothetical protein